MLSFLAIAQIIITFALIVVILLQRSDAGVVGMGGNSGFMSIRGTKNFLTRATAILAGLFMLCALVISIIAGNEQNASSIIEQVPIAEPKKDDASKSDNLSPSAPGQGEANQSNSVDENKAGKSDDSEKKTEEKIENKEKKPVSIDKKASENKTVEEDKQDNSSTKASKKPEGK